MVSSDILELVTRELLEDVDSDHLPALITVGIFSRQSEKDAPAWNFNKANWRAYAHALNTKLESVDWVALPIEKANEVLVNEIIRAARKTIPRGARKKFTSGWTEELKQAVSSGKRCARISSEILQPRTANDTTPTAEGQNELAKPLEQPNGRKSVMVSILERTPARRGDSSEDWMESGPSAGPNR